MSERTIWNCDGCEEDRVVSGRQGHGDWRAIEVELAGFTGYPVGERGNGRKRFHLCPKCQKQLHEYANPHNWPRPDANGLQLDAEGSPP